MKARARVVPALLTDSPTELQEMVRQANSFADYVQIDVMDGGFVPSRSIGAADLFELDMAFQWEAHLMVNRPHEHISSFVEAGARRIVVHAEVQSGVVESMDIARRAGVEVGLALNPGTMVSDVEYLLSRVDSVLLLTVEPGYYGSRFLPGVLPKVVELRALERGLTIAVDGGIKEQNIAKVGALGVDEICVGSAIFRADSPAEAYRRLQQLANPD